jgi:hypothetical protein
VNPQPLGRSRFPLAPSVRFSGDGATRHLVKPNAVIASHANEAATKNGQLLPNTKAAAFRAAAHVPVYLPLSGRTMEFDADGKCTEGYDCGP